MVIKVGCGESEYDISNFLTSKIQSCIANIREDREMSERLISCASKCLEQAAMIHSEIERIYVSAMDFDAKEKYTEDLKNKIFN